MKNVSEVFAEVRKALTVAEKIAILQKGNRIDPSVAVVLQGAYHPNILWVIPKEDIPEYKPDDVPAGMGYTNIQKELSRIYLFVKGSKRASPDLTLQRRKEILIQMLEAMEKDEAAVFAAMFRKDLSEYGLSYRIVASAFPDLLPPAPTIEAETITIRT